MDLRSLNTLAKGIRTTFTRDHKDVGIRAGANGTVVAIARDAEAPEFPTVYIQLDSCHPSLPAWDNELMLSPECYCDLTAANEGINSRIDPDSIVASMEKTDATVLPSEQGLRQGLGNAAA
jgi:hypothetical protein